MREVPLDQPRLWAEFADPAEPARRFRCDLTWLSSRWSCLYGRGCHGIQLDRPDDGCCTFGAHFTDDADWRRVREVVESLGEDEWQYRPDQMRTGAWTVGRGRARRTTVIDGACILLNRPGFPAGAGCALHQRALADGLAPHLTKPDVCWQLPLRRSYRTVELPDGTSYLEITIGEFDRRAWGPGGHDLSWYCTGSPQAHVAAEPVYVSLRAELVELIGPEAYAVVSELCDAQLRDHPGVAMHAATQAAGTIG